MLCSILAETEFEEAAEREKQEELAETERLSQEHEDEEEFVHPMKRPRTSPVKAKLDQEEMWSCPICQRPQPANERLLNEHIDSCLSRDTIREAVNETIDSAASSDTEKKAHLAEKTNLLSRQSGTSKKRGRPSNVSTRGIELVRHGGKKQKTFFG